MPALWKPQQYEHDLEVDYQQLQEGRQHFAFGMGNSSLSSTGTGRRRQHWQSMQSGEQRQRRGQHRCGTI